MKIEDFEKRILSLGLEPVEVRLHHNQVKWFVCKSTGVYPFYLYDEGGKAFVLAQFDWEKNVDSIQIREYGRGGVVYGISVNGVPVKRCQSKDIAFS